MAIGELVVGQAGIIPGLCVVALGAGAIVMAVRGVVAAGAIGVTVMNKPDLVPIGDVVTGRTLAGFVRFWRNVASGAIVLAVVIESDFVPCVGSVA